MRTLLLSIALIGLVGCGNVIVNNDANDGGSANGNADGAGPSHQPPSEVSQADVIDVLTRWRDQIYPVLSDKERPEIETFVAAFPLKAPTRNNLAFTYAGQGDYGQPLPNSSSPSCCSRTRHSTSKDGHPITTLRASIPRRRSRVRF